MKASPFASATRRQILRAALRLFAQRGYAATSVQDIVDAARVSKPTLYYYFSDKAGLYRALVDEAHDERYRLMQVAAARGVSVAQKLTEMLAAVFDFSQKNRALLRLSFASAFAAPGEVPRAASNLRKGRRNFELMREVVAQGQASGELDHRFDSEELAFGIFGQLNSYVMVRLLLAQCRLDRPMAERVVDMFLRGAKAPAGANGKPAQNHRPPHRQRASLSKTSRPA